MPQNDIEQMRDAQKERAELAKAKQNHEFANESPFANLLTPEEKAEAESFKGKLANFIYYHKKPMILGTVCAVLVLVILANVFRPYPQDDYINIVCSTELDAEVFVQAVTRYAVGTNKDGEVVYGAYQFEYDEERIRNELDYKGNQEELVEGDKKYRQHGSLYLVDEAAYEKIIAAFPNHFIDLNSYFPDHPNVSGRRFFIKGSEFAKELGDTVYPDDLAFIVRAHDSHNNGQIKTLRNIIANQKTKKPGVDIPIF